MPVVIRLSRGGSVHQPKYRVNVADSRFWRDGRFIETIGFYNPNPSGKEVGLKIDLTKYNEWVKKGAQPTDRVAYLAKLAAKS